MSRRRALHTGGIELPKPAPMPPPAAPPAPAIEEAPAQLYTIREAAARLAVSARTLERLVDVGRVRTVRIGVQIRISEAELRRIVRDGTQ